MKVIYQKTKDFTKGQWLRIFISLGVMSLITGSLTLIFTGGKIFNMGVVMAEAASYDMMELAVPTIMNTLVSVSALSLIVGVLKTILNFGMTVELKEAYADNRNVGLSSAFSNIKENFLKYGLLSLVISVIQSFISILSFVFMFVVTLVLTSFTVSSFDSTTYVATNTGSEILAFLVGVLMMVLMVSVFVLILYVTLSLSFAPFITNEKKDMDVLDVVKESFDKTKGHKMNIFKGQMRYFLMAMIPYFLSFVLLIFFMIIGLEGIAVGLFFVGMFAVMAAIVYYMPSIASITGVYYVEYVLDGGRMYRIDPIIDVMEDVEEAITEELKSEVEETEELAEDIIEESIDSED